MAKNKYWKLEVNVTDEVSEGDEPLTRDQIIADVEKAINRHTDLADCDVIECDEDGEEDAG